MESLFHQAGAFMLAEFRDCSSCEKHATKLTLEGTGAYPSPRQQQARWPAASAQQHCRCSKEQGSMRKLSETQRYSNSKKEHCNPKN